MLVLRARCSRRPRVKPPPSSTRRISSDVSTKDALRRLLRETAQPVAVVTSILDIDNSRTHHPFHGATLSSFSSIALDPHPLVSFSLRIPSRLATALKAFKQNQAAETHMVVNILSDQQEDVAVRFSRADLYENPFVDTAYHLTQDGLPVLTGSLGALTCNLEKCISLHDLCEANEQMADNSGVISELFISRVLRVEDTHRSVESSPLLYHHRKYAFPKLLDSRLKR